MTHDVSQVQADLGSPSRTEHRPGSSGRMDDILWKEGLCRVIEDVELSQKISEDA